MSKTTTLALVGTGDIGAVYASAIAALPEVDLCIVAGRNPARAAQLAARHRARLVATYQSALDDQQIDGIVLCIPNDLHRPFAEQAFAAGKHVLCEKPIALTLTDADAMLAAAERAGRYLMVAHVLRFWPEYQRAHALVTAGELGEPLWLSLRRLTPVLWTTAGQAGWRQDPARSGGAAIDLLVHDLDFACWLFGPPTSLVARGVRSDYGSWDHVVAILSYAAGLQVLIEGSFLLAGTPLTIDFHLLCRSQSLSYRFDPSDFDLHGTAQTQDKGQSAALTRYRRDLPAEVLLVQRPNAFGAAIRHEINYFVGSIHEGVPPAIATGPDARLALRLALAVQTSCETGQSVMGPFDVYRTRFDRLGHDR
jgi:predicted dehydrogenase